MIQPDLPRLQRVLGGDGLAHLRARLRKRLESGTPETDRFSLGQLTPDAATALAGLLGRPPRARASMQLSYAELDAALARAGLAQDLRQALEALDGPIRDSGTARERRRSAWAATTAGAVDLRLKTALADASAQGLLKRLAGGDAGKASTLIRQADTVLATLPAGGISLARLAADTLGNAHALDAGQPVGTLVRRALASRDAAIRPRELWAEHGVLVNELAKPVVVLNLEVGGSGVAAQLMRAAAATGEPLHLSLRLLTHHTPAWPPNQRIFVCENPAVLAAAATSLGPRCPPLISIDGQLSAAPRTLLDQLAAAGGVFHYHGDFDWGGVRIANYLYRRYGFIPWRFGAADYQPNAGPALPADPVAAAWDAALAPRMERGGVAIHEESTLSTLLADLAERCEPHRAPGAGRDRDGDGA